MGLQLHRQRWELHVQIYPHAAAASPRIAQCNCEWLGLATDWRVQRPFAASFLAGLVTLPATGYSYPPGTEAPWVEKGTRVRCKRDGSETRHRQADPHPLVSTLQWARLFEDAEFHCPREQAEGKRRWHREVVWLIAIPCIVLGHWELRGVQEHCQAGQRRDARESPSEGKRSCGSRLEKNTPLPIGGSQGKDCQAWRRAEKGCCPTHYSGITSCIVIWSAPDWRDTQEGDSCRFSDIVSFCGKTLWAVFQARHCQAVCPGCVSKTPGIACNIFFVILKLFILCLASLMFWCCLSFTQFFPRCRLTCLRRRWSGQLLSARISDRFLTNGAWSHPICCQVGLWEMEPGSTREGQAQGSQRCRYQSISFKPWYQILDLTRCSATEKCAPEFVWVVSCMFEWIVHESLQLSIALWL